MKAMPVMAGRCWARSGVVESAASAKRAANLMRETVADGICRVKAWNSRRQQLEMSAQSSDRLNLFVTKELGRTNAYERYCLRARLQPCRNRSSRIRASAPQGAFAECGGECIVRRELYETCFDGVLMDVCPSGLEVCAIAYVMIGEAALPYRKVRAEAMRETAFDELHGAFERDVLRRQQ